MTKHTKKRPRVEPQSNQPSLALMTVGLLAFAAHWRMLGHGFVDYDTLVYVVENPQVLMGLGLGNVNWAFTTFTGSNWHPLTWLSHMLDVDIYGLHAFGHHLTSLLLHAGNAMLLFALLRRMTGAVWRSAMVAALLAVHPVHVESVAWVAERKDVLSLFLGLLAMIAYARYTEKPGVGRYLGVMLLLALGLLAKPMLVTVPCLMLLLDFWPLGRVKGWGPPPALPGGKPAPRAAWLLCLEKVPLLGLSLGSSIITSIAQHHGGAMVPVQTMGVLDRMGNALTSYAAYWRLLVFPKGLAVFYPLRNVSWWAALGGFAFVAVFTALVLRFRRKAPWAVTGWFWYLGALVPVIGLVQVGGQSMADRYAYMPFIGCYVLIVWTVPVLVERLRLPESLGGGKRLLAMAAMGWIALLAILSVHQEGFWKDSLTLFRHVEDVTENTRLITGWLGDQLLERGEYEEAAEHFAQVAAQDPSDVIALNKQGFAMLSMGRYEEALAHFHTVLEAHPGQAKTYNYMGVCAFALNRYDEALSYFESALEINPHYDEAKDNRNNLRRYMQEQGLLPPPEADQE